MAEPTPDDIDFAVASLSDPKADEQLKAAARRLLSRLPATPKAETPADFGEHSSLGPTGLDVGSPAEIQLGEQSRAFQGQEKAAREHPEVVKALKAQGIMAGAPIASPEEEAQAIAAKAEQRAEMRKQLERPTVFTAPKDVPTEENQVKNPLDIFTNVGPRIANARKLLPSALGGNVEHFVEPDIDEFRKTMAPIMGERAYSVTKDSEEYRDFADAAWANIYDQAQKEGRSVTRHDKQTDKTPAWEGAELVRQAGGAAGTMLNAATGGLGTKYAGRRVAAWSGHPEKGEEEAQNLERVSASANPALNLGAEVAGMVESPIFKGAGKLVPGATIGRTAAQAGLGSAGYKGAELGTRSMGGEDIGLGQAASEVGQAGTLGVVAGGLFGLGGAGLRKNAANLRTSTPLGEAETAGAKMHWYGVEPGKKVGALREEARAGGYGYSHKPDVNTMMAEKLDEPLNREAARGQAEQKRVAGEAFAEYHAAYGHDRIQPVNAQRALESVHQKLTREGGDVIGGSEPLARAIQNRLASMSHVEVYPAGEASGAIPAKEAMQKGYDVVPAVAKAIGSSVSEIESTPSILDDVDVKIALKNFNPQEHDQLVRGFDDLAEKEGRPGMSSSDLKSLLEAARQDRDLFKGGTSKIPSDLTHTIEDAEQNKTKLEAYSARKAIEADKLVAMEKRNNLVKPENVRNYGEPKGPLGRDAALRDIAQSADVHGFPGTSDTLELSRGNRAVERLEEASKLRSGARMHGLTANPVEHLSGTAMRLRLDPFLGAIEPEVGRGASMAATAADKRLSRKPNDMGADQDTINKIQRLLGVVPP